MPVAAGDSVGQQVPACVGQVGPTSKDIVEDVEATCGASEYPGARW